MEKQHELCAYPQRVEKAVAHTTRRATFHGCCCNTFPIPPALPHTPEIFQARNELDEDHKIFRPKSRKDRQGHKSFGLWGNGCRCIRGIGAILHLRQTKTSLLQRRDGAHCWRACILKLTRMAFSTLPYLSSYKLRLFTRRMRVVRFPGICSTLLRLKLAQSKFSNSWNWLSRCLLVFSNPWNRLSRCLLGFFSILGKPL